MRILTILLLLTSFYYFNNVALAEEAKPSSPSASNGAKAKKSPRSLLGVDPYDVNGKGVDPFDVDGTAPLDPFDIDGAVPLDPNDIDSATGMDPNDIGPDPSLQEKEKPAKKKWIPPKFLKEFKQAFDEWGDDFGKSIQEPKPPVTKEQLGLQMGAGYVGAFGGSVIGLFGGFIVGSVYGELANCSRCWIDFAAGGSVVGGSLLSSTGVYIFGNNDIQVGSATATVVGSLVPVALAAIFYKGDNEIGRGGFHLLTMPLFATLGYNLSRHYRKPGEMPLFENIFINDVWVSADPVNGMMAFNLRAEF